MCTCTFLRFCDSKPVGSGTQFACCPVQANVSVGVWVCVHVCLCAKWYRECVCGCEVMQNIFAPMFCL